MRRLVRPILSADSLFVVGLALTGYVTARVSVDAVLLLGGVVLVAVALIRRTR